MLSCEHVIRFYECNITRIIIKLLQELFTSIVKLPKRNYYLFKVRNLYSATLMRFLFVQIIPLIYYIY